MTTYRKTYTKILESEDINDMPDDFTRLTWTWLPLIVDREGRSLDDLVYIRSKLYPRREDVTTAMISAAMQWFADHEMIRRYIARNKHYFYIINFLKYQGDTRRESASIYPPEGEESGTTVDNPQPGLLSEELLSITKVGVEPATTSGTKLSKHSKPDPGVTPELRVSNSCPDSYSDSDADSDADFNSDSDADAEVKVKVTADPDASTTTTTEAPGSPAAQQRRFEDLRHKVRTIFGDSTLYQSFLVDACNKYSLDELESAINEAMSQGYKQWKDIIGILRKRARAKPKSTAPPVVA